METIYFDYNATTPTDLASRLAMEPFLAEVFGNPSSIHRLGRQARSHLDELRGRVAHLWKCKPSEVTFTSGGTESNNLAIFGSARRLRSKGRHLVTTTIEHHAVLHCFNYLQAHEGFEVTFVPVTSSGHVEPATLANALRPDTVLVSMMAANNEIGTIQPVAEVGRLCRERGIVFHTDAAQYFGKIPVPDIHHFEADLVSVCGHKFHAPKGSGALFIRSPLQPEPILFGGGHENERRAGTENLPAIAGFVAALELFTGNPVFSAASIGPLRNRLLDYARALQGVRLVGREPRLSNTLAMTVEGSDSIALLASLDLEGICASSGSACSAGSLEPSHVLLALGLDSRSANSLVRFSLGRDSTAAEVERVISVLPKVLEQARRR